MGKPTGFLEYNRETSKAVSPKERIKNFNDDSNHFIDDCGMFEKRFLL